MSKSLTIDVKAMPNPSKAKVKMLQLIGKYPDKSKMEIGKELVSLGLLVKPENIYQMTRKNRNDGYMSGKIEEIREKNFEMMSKEIVPEALKIHKRVLKDKSIKDKDKKDWVSLAEKAEFSFDDRKMPTTPVNINIGQLQAIITEKLTRDV